MLKAVAFLDFDHSLLEYDNTDMLILEKLCPSILEHGGDEEMEYRKKGDWNGCMNRRFERLAEANVTKEDIIDCFRKCLLTENSLQYLKLFKEHNIPVHIISDSNTLFIEAILESSNALQYISSIHTNPHAFVGNKLTIGKYHEESNCHINTCPRNICKGAVVKGILEKLDAEELKPQMKIYVGDGSNDYCPCTIFGENDLIFAKKNYPLHKKILNNQGDVKSRVVEWEHSLEILQYLAQILVH